MERRRWLAPMSSVSQIVSGLSIATDVKANTHDVRIVVSLLVPFDVGRRRIIFWIASNVMSCWILCGRERNERHGSALARYRHPCGDTHGKF